MNKKLKVAISQIEPVWLKKQATLEKILLEIKKASSLGCRLIVFAESIVPGYPFWLSRTGGAEFNSHIQKEIFAYFAENSVCIEEGDLSLICNEAKKSEIAIYIGCTERPLDRGGHSLYCSLVFINTDGIICSVHRKLMPTYEERLVWGIGDGNGLKSHQLDGFTLAGLNCWENWMPLTRAAIYAMGTNVHIAVWPGSYENTYDITRFIAKESRSYVISASSILNTNKISSDIPHFELIKNSMKEVPANGGSCIASPNGEWICEPLCNEEGIITADIEMNIVLNERQNFDSSGHYSRPDVLKLHINRERQSIIE